MEEVHSWQTRKNGNPYHIHPYQVAKIYCKVHGRRISETGIIAALLHDNIENAHKSGKEESYNSIEEKFWVEDAIICEVLSKDIAFLKPAKDIQYFTRFHSLETLRGFIEMLVQEKWFLVVKDWRATNYSKWEISQESIRNIAFKVALVKICDRIHNLWTMNGFKAKKIRKKIEETKTFLLDIARELGTSHPQVMSLLIDAIARAKSQMTMSILKEEEAL